MDFSIDFTFTRKRKPVLTVLLSTCLECWFEASETSLSGPLCVNDWVKISKVCAMSVSRRLPPPSMMECALEEICHGTASSI